MMDRGPYEFPQAEQGESGANLSTRMTFTLIWGSLAASYKQQATSHVVSTDNSIHIQQQKLSNTETVPMMMTLISKGLRGDGGWGRGGRQSSRVPPPPPHSSRGLLGFHWTNSALPVWLQLLRVKESFGRRHTMNT